MKHFLLENETYVYREEDYSAEDSFQNKTLLEYFNCLGYLGGLVTSNGVDKRHLKRLIYVSLLMGYFSREGSRVVFGKLGIFFIL